MAKRSFIVWALLILVGGFTLRGLWLTADPPTEDVGVVAHDEGAWTHNARNRALWGTWVTDNWNPVYVAPVFNGLEYVAFRTLGVGTWQARTVPLASGIVAVAFLMAGLAACGTRRAALVGGLLLATNYVFITWNRAALMESTLTAFIVISWASYAMAEKRPLWGLVAGASAVLAHFTKGSAAFFVVAIGLDAAVGLLRSRFRDRGSLFTLAGAAVAGVAILAMFVLPHWRDYYFYNFTMSVERKPAYDLHALKDRLTLLPLANNFYTQMWPAFVVGIVSACAVIVRWSSAKPAQRLLVLWVVLGLAELIWHDSTNSRYHVMLVPAFIALAALLIGPAGGRAKTRESRGLAPVAAVAFLLYGAYLVFGSALQTWLVDPSSPTPYRLAVAVPALVALATAAFALFRLDAATRLLTRVSISDFVAIGVVVVTVGWNLFEYTRWAGDRTFLNYSASLKLGTLLPPGTLVQGIQANGLSLENRIKPLFIGNNFGNYDDRFDRNDVRYILTDIAPREGYESGEESEHLISRILDRYPAVGAPGDRHPIATFDIKDIDPHVRAALFDKLGR